jgi:hypothetical protein
MITSTLPNGQDIWKAINEEFANNLYPLPFTTLAPAVYHVYLHPTDYEEIEGIVPRLVSEISSALTRKVEGLNEGPVRRAGRLWPLSLRKPKPMAIEMPAGGWEICIQPDRDEELPRGAIGIVSKLVMPPPPQFGGTPTARIVKTVFTEGRRETSLADHTAGLPASAAAARDVVDGARATLTYEDEQGAHVFVMRKECIKVGRGGLGTWVDVQVVTSPRVSREHCWILSDAAGKFFVRDVSTWGTRLNGEPVPPAVRSASGTVVEAGTGQEITSGARIGLADAVVIDFQVKASS